MTELSVIDTSKNICSSQLFNFESIGNGPTETA